jgi:hypothetical protein
MAQRAANAHPPGLCGTNNPFIFSSVADFKDGSKWQRLCL